MSRDCGGVAAFRQSNLYGKGGGDLMSAIAVALADANCPLSCLNRTKIATRTEMNECLKLGSGERSANVRVWVSAAAERSTAA